MDSDGAVALAAGKRLIEGLERRDAAVALSALHPDIVVEVAYPIVPGEGVTGSRRSQGPAVRAYVQDAVDRTSVMRFTNVVWRTTNDGLAIFQAEGDHVLSDGRPYPNHFLFMFEQADGKIIRWREYLNPVAAMRAFGGQLDAIP